MGDVVTTLRHAHEGAPGVPTVVIAHTVKGKGVSFMENQFAWHAKPPSDAELAAALLELDEVRL